MGLAARRCDSAYGRVRTGRIHIEDADDAAFGGEALGDRSSDAAAATADDAGFAFETPNLNLLNLRVAVTDVLQHALRVLAQPRRCEPYAARSTAELDRNRRRHHRAFRRMLVVV